MTCKGARWVIDGLGCVIDGIGWVIDGSRCVIDGLSTGWTLETGRLRRLHTFGDKPRRPGGRSVAIAPSITHRPVWCRHQHDAQRCRYGMTKGIDARMGRDSERGSMRSTKARPRLRRGEPERSWLKQAARRHHRPRRHPRSRRRPLAALAARRAARPGVSSPAAGQTYPTPRQACIPASRWT